MTLTNLIVISLIIAAGALFWKQMGIYQTALTAALLSTKKHGVTLLDQSVSLKKVEFSRINTICWPVLKRTYEFEFSTLGDRRYKGWVYMKGERVANVQLQPFAEPHSISLH